MKSTFWIGDGCTGEIFYRTSKWNKRDIARLEYLEANAGRLSLVWPFVHAQCEVDASWFIKGSWPLDPLMIPILHKINEHEHKTVSSCQGCSGSSAHVVLISEFCTIINVHNLIKAFGIGLDTPILAMGHFEEGRGQFWHLWFHDPIALMAFNLRVFGISIKDQVSNTYGRAWRGDFANTEEIEALIH